MNHRPLSAALLVFAGFCPVLASADSVIEYSVKQGGRNAVQPVMIKDGNVLVKGAGGDGNLDVLFERGTERLVLIDHKARRYTPITDAQVGRIAQQAETLQPVLRGIGEQLRKLSPRQREKWAQMLGGVSLDQLDQMGAAQRAVESTRVKKTGIDKHFAGIPCQQMDVMKGKATAGGFCLADPGALKLSEDDAATLRALVGFTQKLAQKAEGLGNQFGMGLPSGGLAGLAGVPIEMRDLGGKHPLTLTLNRVAGEAVTAALQVPEGYREKALNLWP